MQGEAETVRFVGGKAFRTLRSAYQTGDKRKPKEIPLPVDIRFQRQGEHELPLEITLPRQIGCRPAEDLRRLPLSVYATVDVLGKTMLNGPSALRFQGDDDMQLSGDRNATKETNLTPCGSDVFLQRPVDIGHHQCWKGLLRGP